MRTAAIIAAGGRGERLGAGKPKQLLAVGGRTILERSVDVFARCPGIDEIVVVVPPDLVTGVGGLLGGCQVPLTVVAGGPRRQDSVANGFAAVDGRADLVVVHDAARPFASAALVIATIRAAAETGAALAALPCSDTVKFAGDAELPLVERTIPRNRVYLAQTPQAFRADVLRAALAAAAPTETATDEAALAERAGFPVRLVPGEPANIKITTAADLESARIMIERESGQPRVRVGTGYDLHRLVEGRPLILGGVAVPFTLGLAGHSDADVLAHAVTDALLGAAALGDIGRFFPDTDPRWKDADSLAMLAFAAERVRAAGYAITNVDAVIIAERPKLLPHIPAIRQRLADTLGVPADDVSVKGKTNEGVDATGRGEAMAVHAVALLTARGPS